MVTSLLRLRFAALVCTLALLGLAFNADTAFATHFRYGTITWTIPNPAQPNVVVLRFDSVWRWSFPYGGSSVCAPGYIPTGATGPGACPPINSVLPTLGTLDVRTSAGALVTQVNLTPTVTSINTTEDWFAASFTSAPIALPNAGSYLAQFSSSSRLSTLANSNNDRLFTVQAGITIRAAPQLVDQPPTIGTLPIIVLARNQQTSFQLAASDPDGDPLTFRVSTSAESGLLTVQPAGLTLSATGVVAWTPTSNGLYAMQVRVTDPAGAFTVADFIMQVKDAVGLPPVLFIDGSSAAHTLSTGRNTRVTFVVSATDAENTPVMLTANSIPVGATTTPALPLTAVHPSTTFNWTPASPGTFVISFAGLDGDGRQGSNTVAITVTNHLPTIQCTATAEVEATSAAGGPFSMTVNGDDPDRDPLTVSFFVDGAQRDVSGLLTPPATQSYSGTVPIGTHSYQGRVSDGIGTSTCQGEVNVSDTTGPAITVTRDEQAVMAGTPVVFTVSATDAVDPNPAVSCSAPSGTTFPIGDTTVTCTATDASGNQNATSFLVRVTDPTPPVVTPTVTGTRGDNGWFISNVTVTWDVSDPESGAMRSNGCLDTTVSTDVGGALYACTATNGSGEETGPVIVTIDRDTTAPSIAFTQPAITAEATSAAGAAVSFDPPATSDATSGVAGPPTCSSASGALFAIGTSDVTCSVKDKAGNAASATLSITVRDTTAPSLTPFANLTFEATSLNGAAISYTLPAASDLVDPHPTVVCSPASGTVLSLGTHAGTCTATDASGNSSSVLFSMTVRDSTPPVITPSVTGTMGGNGWYTSNVDVSWIVADAQSAISSSTGCGATIVSTDGASITLTCSATSAGGTATQSVTFKRDATAPLIGVPGPITTPAITAAGAVVVYALPAATDAASGIAGVVTCAPASGSVFPIGTSTVSCSVRDAAGNAGVAAFAVLVTNDPTPGWMRGDGYVLNGNEHYDFDFSIVELPNGMAAGELKMVVCPVTSSRRQRGDDEDGDNGRACAGSRNIFVAQTFTFTRFSDDSSFAPGQRATNDTLVASGTGTWNRGAGYAFELKATDHGEPGKKGDTFEITVTAPGGAVVAVIPAGEAMLAAGNVQSGR
jgi:hypothetical protein